MNNTILQEGSFSITKDQLRQLTDPKIKEWFPEVFEVKLEVGKWATIIPTITKSEAEKLLNIKIID